MLVTKRPTKFQNVMLVSPFECKNVQTSTHLPVSFFVLPLDDISWLTLQQIPTQQSATNQPVKVEEDPYNNLHTKKKTTRYQQTQQSLTKNHTTTCLFFPFFPSSHRRRHRRCCYFLVDC